MIIVGADGSVTARAAVEWAAGDAARRHVPLRVVHVTDTSWYLVGKRSDAVLPDSVHKEGRRVLREAEALVRERQPAAEVSTRELTGTPAEVLREQAGDTTELVVGSRGLGGLSSALLGSVSAHVAGHVSCPVVVVRAEHRPVHGEVVVGLDDSPECEPALAYAFEQAELRGASLRVVHAWQLPVHAYAPEAPYDLDEVRVAQHQAVRDRVTAAGQDHPRVTVVEEAPCARPADALTAASEQADLLVVGSHGRGTLGAALLGSVSRGVLHHARCPVAVVRA
ncbi:Universal stress protein family [[Actinomadura] parvosata subsp. kistnae]|uniref:Universal stress protein UspA n=1 Tax=[Actinomadura] parvosata subsp. kistnae TaxID=1909395 RepID=A0A1U9ZZ91_9ACTN|nr:universal stress protein [Nonomuraea sp. ATCC 55076]AQZ63262.1 universal stress protein UspA [Nonomuraea sp. ATCC 55076]SPL98944.1 Universal stress protein family [Actinomadura parvosata subsp. kistnae]